MEIPLANALLDCGVSWEFAGSPIDIDVSALVFDEYGNREDVAFYNNVSICGGNVVHSGDSRDGLKEGDDEKITLNLPNLDGKTIIFVINAYSAPAVFSSVKSGNFRLYQNGVTVHEYPLVELKGTDTAAIIAAVRQNEATKEWQLRVLSTNGTGRTFDECEPLIETVLFTLYDPYILGERTRKSTKTYSMQKGDIYVVDPQIHSVSLGLGWDAGSSSVDVDASVCTYDSSFTLLESIYFGNKKGHSSAIVHSGDNTTGFGSGDDETIQIRLSNLPATVEYVACIITIYRGASAFRNIRNCYANVYAEKHKLCEYKLTSGDISTPGVCMAVLKRRPGNNWGFYFLGKELNGNTCNSAGLQTMMKGHLPRLEEYRREAPAATASSFGGSAPTTTTHAGSTTTAASSDGCCTLI